MSKVAYEKLVIEGRVRAIAAASRHKIRMHWQEFEDADTLNCLVGRDAPDHVVDALMEMMENKAPSELGFTIDVCEKMYVNESGHSIRVMGYE